MCFPFQNISKHQAIFRILTLRLYFENRKIYMSKELKSQIQCSNGARGWILEILSALKTPVVKKWKVTPKNGKFPGPRPYPFDVVQSSSNCHQKSLILLVTSKRDIVVISPRSSGIRYSKTRAMCNYAKIVVNYLLHFVPILDSVHPSNHGSSTFSNPQHLHALGHKIGGILRWECNEHSKISKPPTVWPHRVMIMNTPSGLKMSQGVPGILDDFELYYMISWGTVRFGQRRRKVLPFWLPGRFRALTQPIRPVNIIRKPKLATDQWVGLPLGQVTLRSQTDMFPRKLTGWWYTYYESQYSQWEGLSHILWKIINVPNNQPFDGFHPTSKRPLLMLPSHVVALHRVAEPDARCREAKVVQHMGRGGRDWAAGLQDLLLLGHSVLHFLGKLEVLLMKRFSFI